VGHRWAREARTRFELGLRTQGSSRVTPRARLSPDLHSGEAGAMQNLARFDEALLALQKVNLPKRRLSESVLRTVRRATDAARAHISPDRSRSARPSPRDEPRGSADAFPPPVLQPSAALHCKFSMTCSVHTLLFVQLHYPIGIGHGTGELYHRSSCYAVPRSCQQTLRCQCSLR
jgi:hypothetical protein